MLKKTDNLVEISNVLLKESLKYYSAMEEMETKINIINEDFKMRYKYNPIHHVESRIKTPESILNKLQKHQEKFNIENLNSISDIVGVRIICSFLTDIPYLVQFIKKNDGIKVLEEVDYINNPKVSGYRSYHMIVEIPIYLTTGKEIVKVEIQLRTMAMDFWATLEHKLNYKFEGYVPDHVKSELIECADIVDTLDNKMVKLNTIIKEINT